MLTAEDPWKAAGRNVKLLLGADLDVVAEAEPGTPAGLLTDQMQALDRAFRWATRASENNEDEAHLLRRGGRPIPVADGLVVARVEEGSLRIPQSASRGIQKALDSTGLRVVLAVLALIGASVDAIDLLDSARAPRESDAPAETHFVVPVHGGKLDLYAPGSSELRFRKDGETVVIRLQPAR